MLSWLGQKLVGYTMGRLRAGDPEPTLRLESPDVVVTFPGESSWSGVMHGKEAHRRWLERLCRVGIQLFPDEVIVKGFPWNQTVCVRGHDYLRSPEGQTVYENRVVIWGRMKWGRIVEIEDYLDTARLRTIDDYLAVNEPALAS
jgi:ketosteroid isomerase-like protein